MGNYYPLNGLRLCVDKKENDTLGGRVYTPLNKNMIAFNDLTNMFLAVDKIFDHNNYPKSYQHKRSFSNEKIVTSSKKVEAQRDIKDIINEHGKLISFDVIVISRQHSNWQGLVKLLSGEVINSFKSELELIDFIVNYDL